MKPIEFNMGDEAFSSDLSAQINFERALHQTYSSKRSARKANLSAVSHESVLTQQLHGYDAMEGDLERVEQVFSGRVIDAAVNHRHILQSVLRRGSHG